MAAHPRRIAGIALLAVSLAAPVAASAQPVHRTHGPDPVGATAPVARVAGASNAGGWCPNTDPAANQFQNGEYRYRAIYAHPADRPSRLATLGAQFERDAFGASALIESQYGRAIRFDVGTPCGAGRLDITEVQLPFTEAELAGLAGAERTATFDAVADALRERGFGLSADVESVDEIALRKENFLVWLDGPAPARSCGQGTAMLDDSRSDANLNNFGGKLALIFRHGAAFCGADVVRHEIGHNLGALQPEAPNTTDGAHCTDAFEDTMCEGESPSIVDGDFNSRYFDYGNDDYWDPPQGPALGWWTLNLSRFICADRHCNRPEPAAAPAPAPAADAAPIAAESAPPASRPAAKPEISRPLRRPRLARRVARGKRYTRLHLRAQGSGTARLVVRCPGRGHRAGVVSRRIALPSAVRVRTTCRAPQARLVDWHRPRRAAS